MTNIMIDELLETTNTNVVKLSHGIEYNAAINRATPFMQGLYRAFRLEGFDRVTTKNILEIALKCAMVNESFGEGVDNSECK